MIDREPGDPQPTDLAIDIEGPEGERLRDIRQELIVLSRQPGWLERVDSGLAEPRWLSGPDFNINDQDSIAENRRTLLTVGTAEGTNSSATPETHSVYQDSRVKRRFADIEEAFGTDLSVFDRLAAAWNDHNPTSEVPIPYAYIGHQGMFTEVEYLFETGDPHIMIGVRVKSTEYNYSGDNNFCSLRVDAIAVREARWSAVTFEEWLNRDLSDEMLPGTGEPGLPNRPLRDLQSLHRRILGKIPKKHRRP